MKNLFLVLVAAVTFSAQSYAYDANQCVPTKSVADAKAEYDSSIAAITTTVRQSYATAMTVYNNAIAQVQVSYDQKVVAINANYDAEVKEITKNLNLGWQEALKASTAKHNQDLDLASAQFGIDAQNHYTVYNRTVAQAKATFDAKAQVIAAKYNKDVCAE